MAGIDLDKSKWIRPIGNGFEGAIGNERLVNGTEPELLDILEIPVGESGPNYNCQCENVRLKPGVWKKIDSAPKQMIQKYCKNSLPLLHNGERRLPIEYFNSISPDEWTSLQLIEVKDAAFERIEWPERVQYISRFSLDRQRFKLNITDPNIRNKLNLHQPISKTCIMTISLASPWKGYCYKLATGVIEF